VCCDCLTRRRKRNAESVTVRCQGEMNLNETYGMKDECVLEKCSHQGDYVARAGVVFSLKLCHVMSIFGQMSQMAIPRKATPKRGES
jgi:hypothetical protein